MYCGRTEAASGASRTRDAMGRYGRAGYSRSEPGRLPRHSAQVAEELRVLLQGAKIRGPYVLVEQSLGGLSVRQVHFEIPCESGRHLHQFVWARFTRTGIRRLGRRFSDPETLPPVARLVGRAGSSLGIEPTYAVSCHFGRLRHPTEVDGGQRGQDRLGRHPCIGLVARSGPGYQGDFFAMRSQSGACC